MIKPQFMDLLFLIPLCAIGIIASWQDWRAGRVRNRLVAVGAVYGLLILFLLFLPLGWPDGWRISAEYLSKAAGNGAIALFAGFLLYKYNFLAPGDAKLFFVFSLLIPLKYYSGFYLPVFPSFIMLVNIFLPLLSFIFLQAAWFLATRAAAYGRGAVKIDGAKAMLAIKKAAWGSVSLLIGMIALYILVRGFTDFVSRSAFFGANPALMYLIFFALYRPLSAYMRKNRLLPAIALAVVIFYVAHGWFYDRAGLIVTLGRAAKMAVIFLAIFGLAKSLLDYYVGRRTTRALAIRDLEAGMRLSDAGHKDNWRNKLTGVLTEEHILRLREWAEKNKVTKIRVYRKFAFAPWMFLGVIITVIFRQPVIFTLGDMAERIFNIF
jgi:Flp pilus assembly protein protease CpaA